MVPKIFDALLELEASNTRTASGVGAALAFPLTPVNPWNTDGFDYDIAPVFDVSALTLSGGTVEAYVEADSASGFPSATKVARMPITAVGRYILPIHLDTVKLLESAATHLRSGITITGGTSPSITYRAFITKC